MSEEQMVLVTGATGFIATHVIQQLLQAGHKVRGSVRSLKNEQKIKPLQELHPKAKYPLELVEADLTSANGWADAVSGCTYVIHMASPFPNEQPSDESEVIKPAVDGTLIVLKACREARTVKRVVLTSSVASISGGFDIGGSYTEADWTDVGTVKQAYLKSKTLAEKAAWDFVRDLPNGEKFELSVINPAFVMGPPLCGGWATSMELTKRLLERQMPAVPQINFSIIDVRDVAAAHIAAMTKAEAAGNRHIVAAHNLWMKEIAMMYKEEFLQLGYNVPVREAPYFILKLISLFDKTVRLLLPAWGKETFYDNTRMHTVLGIEPRPARETVMDMAHSMIQKGFIKTTATYRKVKL